MASEKNGTSSTATPRLRFPEFREADGWAQEPLSKAIQLVSGMHLSPEQYDASGKIPYFTGPSDFTNDVHSVSKWTTETTATGKRDNTLITVKGNGVGEVWYLTLDSVAMGRQLMAVRTRNGSSRFIHQFLLTKRTRFEDLGSGNLIPGLSRGDILDLVAPFPSEPEQLKIADCLTSLDEMIAAQGRKVAALADHKRGLMQQLFPREGETLPRLRFPEFRNTWQMAKLGTLLKEGRLGGNYENSVANEGIPVIKMGNIERGIVNTERLQYLPGDAKYESADVLREGDLLFNTRNTLELVGKVAIWKSELPQALYNSNLMRFRFSEAFEQSNRFANYLFNTEVVISRLRGLATGTTSVAAIYRRDLDHLVVPYPPVEEQQRIAACLSDLDARIAAESEKLDALKTHKKALMQQLFPATQGAA